VRIEGYAWPNTTINATLVPLTLYYNSQYGDHFSTWYALEVFFFSQGHRESPVFTSPLSPLPSTPDGHAYALANGYDYVMDQAYVIANSTDLTQQFYEGIFTRIQQAYSIDYYWIWYQCNSSIR
jgi:hypothetical protein